MFRVAHTESERILTILDEEQELEGTAESLAMQRWIGQTTIRTRAFFKEC